MQFINNGINYGPNLIKNFIFLKKKIFSNRNEMGNRKEYPLY